MGWFGISAAERQQCLTYYEAGLTVIAFQGREADAYDDTLGRYLNAVAEDPIAAGVVYFAAMRLVQAAQEALRRYDQIRPIPEAASSLHLAWRAGSVSYLSWAEGLLPSIAALMDGATPDFGHAQSLVEKRESANARALPVAAAFLRRLRVEAADVEAITRRSLSTAAADPWRPKPTLPDVSLYFNCGCEFFKREQYAWALAAFQNCIEIDPTCEDAYVGLGNTYMSFGQHAPAIEAFRKALDINPNDAQAHFNLGCIYQNLGRYEDALTSYRAAAAARPDYALPYCNIGVLALGFGRYKESAEAYEKAIALDPNLPPALLGLASAYFRLADYEHAFEVCRRILQAHPEHSDAQQLLAAIQAKRGEVATSCSHPENLP